MEFKVDLVLHKKRGEFGHFVQKQADVDTYEHDDGLKLQESIRKWQPTQSFVSANLEFNTNEILSAPGKTTSHLRVDLDAASAVKGRKNRIPDLAPLTLEEEHRIARIAVSGSQSTATHLTTPMVSKGRPRSLPFPSSQGPSAPCPTFRDEEGEPAGTLSPEKQPGGSGDVGEDVRRLRVLLARQGKMTARMQSEDVLGPVLRPSSVPAETAKSPVLRPSSVPQRTAIAFQAAKGESALPRYRVSLQGSAAGAIRRTGEGGEEMLHGRIVEMEEMFKHASPSLDERRIEMEEIRRVANAPSSVTASRGDIILGEF